MQLTKIRGKNIMQLTKIRGKNIRKNGMQLTKKSSKNIRKNGMQLTKKRYLKLVEKNILEKNKKLKHMLNNFNNHYGRKLLI